MPDDNTIPDWRPMTDDEASEALRAAMHLHVSKVKIGRVTFYEAVSRGLDSFASRVAAQLRLSGIAFLKKPPIERHFNPTAQPRIKEEED